jgi:hypothetical protein
VDATYEFMINDVGVYGMQSVGGTFLTSRVFQMLKNGNLNIPPDECLPCANISMPYVFVADEGYILIDNLLKPCSGENRGPDTV